ncbi:MAG: M48 family metallopeptidase [Bacteroidota bacterium]
MSVPLKKHYEYRSGYRATIGKQAVIFRLPVLAGPTLQDVMSAASEMELKLQKWVEDTYQKKPEAFSRLVPVSVPDQGYITVMEQEFEVAISKDRKFKSHKATVDVGNPFLIHIELTGSDRRSEAVIVDALLSRIFSDRYHHTIWRRLQELNNRFFQVRVDGLRLKNTTSVWGSCTSSGNINLSSRLLLVPQHSRDSVIIHELAHRIEMNHSARFWALVYDAMPTYDEAHDELKKYDRGLRFLPVGK